MKNHFLTHSFIALLLLTSGTVFAQGVSGPFCTAGLQPDGFVDWSKLPKSPTSGGVSVTIPVAGQPALTATLSIPNPTPPNTPAMGNNFYYLAQNPADLTIITGSDPIITFSKPVKGVSAEMATIGRFGHNFSMTAFNEAGFTIKSVGPPPDAQVSSGGGDCGVGNLSTSPFTIRTLLNDIVAVQFHLEGAASEGYGAYDILNFRVETGTAPDPALQVPTSGLQEWLRGDKVVAFVGPTNQGNLTNWPDQSGHGNDATPAVLNQNPAAIAAGPSCANVVSFFGESLRFTLPINGWTAMTVFLVSQAYTDQPGWWQGEPLIWDETQQWGSTFFAPSQTNESFRFGTTQVNNQPQFVRPMTIGGDMTVATFVHDGTTDSAWTNGTLVFTQGGKEAAINGTGPSASIGVGLNGTPFTGNIGEILVYNRVLTTVERETVQHYLFVKYGVR